MLGQTPINLRRRHLAAQAAGGKFYFYDCEHGLYLYDTKLEWKA